MTYSRKDQEVTIKFSIEEFEDLMSVCGYALIAAQDKGHDAPARNISRFICKLNETNYELAFYYERTMKKPDAKQDTTGSSRTD